MIPHFRNSSKFSIIVTNTWTTNHTRRVPTSKLHEFVEFDKQTTVSGSDVCTSILENNKYCLTFLMAFLYI